MHRAADTLLTPNTLSLKELQSPNNKQASTTFTTSSLSTTTIPINTDNNIDNSNDAVVEKQLPALRNTDDTSMETSDDISTTLQSTLSSIETKTTTTMNSNSKTSATTLSSSSHTQRSNTTTTTATYMNNSSMFEPVSPINDDVTSPNTPSAKDEQSPGKRVFLSKEILFL